MVLFSGISFGYVCGIGGMGSRASPAERAFDPLPPDDPKRELWIRRPASSSKHLSTARP
jgi:hypothetical protein